MPFTAGQSGHLLEHNSLVSWVNVKRYGAVGDGTTDDTAAIQAALTFASAATGSVTVYFPAGVYRLATSSSASGIAYCLYLTGDNVTLRGEGAKSILRNVHASAGTLFITGSGKPEGIANWLKYAPWRFAGDTYAGGGAISPVALNALRTITGGTRGAMTVTLATPAQASDFVAGDTVIIRTGQLVANGSNWNGEPDSEYNVVKSASTGTGLVTFERPLCKTYATEYQAAIGGISSTTVAAVTCPLGISKITSAVQKTVALERLRFEVTVSTAAPILIRGVVDGFREEDIQYDCIGVAHDALEYRDFTFKRIRATMRGTHREDFWPVTVAVGCSDGRIEDVVGIATEKTCTLHIHEGSSRISVQGVTLMSGSLAGSANNEISIRARAYDVSVEDYTIVGANSGVAVFIGSDCTGGGKIGKGTIRKPAGTRSVLCQAANWQLEGPSDGKGGDISIDPLVRALGVAQPLTILYGWLSDDVQTQTLGLLPAQSVVLGGGVSVYEAFNSAGTDMIRSGFPGFTNAFFGDVDVSTVGFKAVTMANGYLDTNYTANATYTAGGTAPTTGKALVWLYIATAPTHVA